MIKVRWNFDLILINFIEIESFFIFQDVVSYFVRMFASLNRSEEMHKYCRKVIAVDIVRMWKTLIEAETNPDVLEIISNFYENLNATWFNQVIF